MILSEVRFGIQLSIAFIGYAVISKLIFDVVYSTTSNVIDELFHIPQGIAYCNGNFYQWDSKITTLPGLYLLSAPLGLFLECNVYNLRMINLIGSCLNFLLLASIFKYIYSTEDPKKVILQSVNLAILPPLYFFSHVYYTDTWSLTFLLIYSRLCLTNCHYVLVTIFGLLCVLMRQTNVVWVGMMFVQKFLDVFIKSSRVFGNKRLHNLNLKKNSGLAQDIDNSKLKRFYSFHDLKLAKNYHLTTHFNTFFGYISDDEIYALAAHSFVLTVFIIFVYCNGSIVLGDKQAHEATIHVSQLLYFLLFYGFFAFPHVLVRIPSTLRLIVSNKGTFFFFLTSMLLIVHYNTLAHPYLLADNRHYTFYIWNRWFGKYLWAKYATVPAYLFLLFNLYDNLKDCNCISFLFSYVISFVLVLSLQRMIEVRYFLVPYIILRLRFNRPSWMVVIFEFFWCLFVNYLTFNLFFYKEIEWINFDDIQRLMW